LNLWRGNPAGALLVALVCVVWCSAPVKGRQAPGAPLGSAQGKPANQVESDPIKCWWKTDTNAVRIGEPFTLALTCGVVETDAVRVVVDPARLDPAVVEAAPFEVIGGTRHDDIVAPPWRYFQYSYTLRLLGETFFGRDVDIPGLPLTYQIQPANGDTGQARDQLYLLPALPLRVLSLVPVTATDIRDAPRDTFADIESRRWRATREFAASGVFFVLAALLVGVAAARALGRSRAGRPDVVPLLPLAAVFGACEREMQNIKSDAAGGWTPALVGRALAASRIAGAVALGRPVAQTAIGPREQPREGQLLLEMGLWNRRRVLMSASTTAATITERLATDGEVELPLREALEDLAAGLEVFGGTHYSRGGSIDGGRLDEAMDRGLRGLERLRSARRWPGRVAEAVGRTVAAFRQATWAR
jgi:hypothetical protein